MIVADGAGRTLLTPLEVPVGVITAIVGGPYHDAGRIIAEGCPRQIVTPELVEQLYGVRCMRQDPLTGMPVIAGVRKRQRGQV